MILKTIKCDGCGAVISGREMHTVCLRLPLNEDGEQSEMVYYEVCENCFKVIQLRLANEE